MHLVKEVMEKKVITFHPNETMAHVLHRLSENRISGAPVIDKRNKVVGLVSESDILKAIDTHTPNIRFSHKSTFAVVLAFLESGDEFEAIKGKIHRIKVKDFMSKELHAVSEDETVINAMRAINKYNVKRLPVIDKKGKLLGIISRADILRALEKKHKND